MENIPTNPLNSNVQPSAPVNITRKYIIAGVAGLAFLTAIYVGYTFFKTSPAMESSDLNNKLSPPADNEVIETSKLNDVVNELKEQYNTPPGINIQLENTTPAIPR